MGNVICINGCECAHLEVKKYIVYYTIVLEAARGLFVTHILLCAAILLLFFQTHLSVFVELFIERSVLQIDKHISRYLCLCVHRVKLTTSISSWFISLPNSPCCNLPAAHSFVRSFILQLAGWFGNSVFFSLRMCFISLTGRTLKRIPGSFPLLTCSGPQWDSNHIQGYTFQSHGYNANSLGMVFCPLVFSFAGLF